MTTYTVKSGDTISKIARDELGDMNRWPELAALNGITSPWTIFPGQTLQLPDIQRFRAPPVSGAGTMATREQIMGVQADPFPLNWPLIIAGVLALGGLLWFVYRKNA